MQEEPRSYTESVAETAAQQAQEPSRAVEFAEEAPVETLNELYSKLFFGGGKSPYREITKYLPSGYLNEEEIRLMHWTVENVRNLAVLEDRFLLDIETTGHFFLRQLAFIPMVSKSRLGFAIKETGTNRIRSDESHMIQDAAQEKPGLLEKLKGIGGGGRGSGILPPRRDDMWAPQSRDRYGSWGERDRRYA